MHSRNLSAFVAVLCVVSVALVPGKAFALLSDGAAGNSIPDFVYDFNTGNVTIVADGAIAGIGTLQITSASDMFIGANATLPDGLLTTANDTEIGGVGFNPAPSEMALGQVLAPGLAEDLLLSDIFPATVSAGLGSPNLELTLICVECGDPNTAPVGMDDIAVGFKGTTFDYQFVATDAEDDPSALTWSNLVFNSGPGGATPANAPTLGADGAFSWAIAAGPADDPQGEWSWTATVTDTGGLTGSATLRVDVTIPEPATALLMGLAVAGLAFIRRR